MAKAGWRHRGESEVCQRSRHLQAVAPLQPWEWPKRPWARVHVDYAGPLFGHMFFVLVDAHSKWMEVKTVRSATSSVTITLLRSIFATHGLPEFLVSDNGSVFTSTEFQSFLRSNGIRHSTSAPYHPATNGLAERAVQTFKHYIKKTSGDTLETKFLFQYRITPHATTGVSPAELLLKRRPRSCLDLLVPDITTKVVTNQQRQKVSHDSQAKARQFNVDDSVCGLLTYWIRLLDGRVVRRHVDHIRARQVSDSVEQCCSHNMFDVPDTDSAALTEELTDPGSPVVTQSSPDPPVIHLVFPFPQSVMVSDVSTF